MAVLAILFLVFLLWLPQAIHQVFVLGSLYIPIPLIIFLFLDVIFLNNLLRKRVRKPAITERIEKIWLTCFLGIVVTFIAFYFFFSNALILGEVLLIITP